MNVEKYDIIFLITGRPLPAMLDMAFYAQKNRRNALMVILERGNDDLVIDQNLVNFKTETINVPYKGVDLRRFFSIPSILFAINRIIKYKLSQNGVVIASSYDLLLFSCLIRTRKKFSLRYQVRDLHKLQLSKTLLSSVIVNIEKLLLRKVESIIVSSPEFLNRYFNSIYKGKAILLENTPSKTTWDSFTREKTNNIFKIGFIGIIRYEESLKQLITAVESLDDLGIKVVVKFAGGGNINKLKQMVNKDNLFEILGPYEYTKDIKGLYADIDLIYAVYDSNDLNCQVAMPNKFYESIITKIPIIVANGTFVGREVERLGIGTTVYTGDTKTLEALLKQATNNEGWYKRALIRVNDVNADNYYEAYNIAMEQSVSQQ